MIIYSFLFGGFICLIGQIVLDNTKLTPGHLNSILVTIGSLLSFLNIYDKIFSLTEAGSSIMIINFGKLLYEGALLGYKSDGIIGLFGGVFNNVSIGISLTIFISFIISILFRPKN